MEMNRHDLQYCCWCGKKQPFGAFDEEHAVSEEEANISLLLELLGISSSLLNEDIVYRMCNDCAELVSYGTDLKIQSELEKNVTRGDSRRLQLDQLEKDLKLRARKAPFILGNEYYPLIGFQLSKCFSECFVELRPEDDALCAEKLYCDQENTCIDIKVEIDEASPAISEPDFSCIKYEVSSDGEMCDVDTVTHDSKSYTTPRIAETTYEVTNSQVKAKEEAFQNPDNEEKVELIEMTNDDVAEFSRSPTLQSASVDEIVKTILKETFVPDPDTFECCGCSETFTTRKDRYIHEKKHTVVRDGRDVYKCDECGRVVLSAHHLRTHRRSHEQGFSICDLCGKTVSKKSLQTHRRKEHNLRMLLECKTCNKKFWTQYTLRHHEATCPKRSQVPETQGSVADEKQEQQPCAATTENKLVSENDTTDRSDVKSKECSTPTATADKLYECGGCFDTFETISAKLNHERTHVVLQADGRTAYKCGICGKEASNYHQMNVHSKAHLKTPPTCKICGKIYASKTSLNQHMDIHNPKKVFKCEICDSKFARQGRLVTHSRIHTGEKPFVCELCGRTFARTDKLASHRRVHTGEKPFGCEICKRRFARREKLNLHVRSHTGEKPYACEICGRKFAANHYLASHKKIRHKGKKSDEMSTKKTRSGRKRNRSPSKSWSDEDVSDCEQGDQAQVVVKTVKMTLREKKQRRVFTKSSSESE